MQSIFKYPLDRRIGWQTINMPQGARVLCTKAQNGTVCIWAVVDTKAPHVRRTFAFVGTGWEIDFEIERTNYIGTVLLSGGGEVYHVFEKVA